MHVVGIVAISLDGCITRHDSEGASFASDADQHYFHQALKSFDCSIFGSGTFRVSQEPILRASSDDHLRVVLTRQPDRYSEYDRPGHLEFKDRELGEVLDELAARGRKHCAMLGGGRWYTECIQQGLMHELWVTLEPLGFGSGKRLFEGEVSFRFRMQSVEHLSPDTLLIKYDVL